MSASVQFEPQVRSRLKLAANHAKTVFGDTPLGTMVQRELEIACDFTWLSQKGGLMHRTAEQIIRLQESQATLPDANGSA